MYIYSNIYQVQFSFTDLCYGKDFPYCMILILILIGSYVQCYCMQANFKTSKTKVEKYENLKNGALFESGYIAWALNEKGAPREWGRRQSRSECSKMVWKCGWKCGEIVLCWITSFRGGGWQEIKRRRRQVLETSRLELGDACQPLNYFFEVRWLYLVDFRRCWWQRSYRFLRH